MKREQKRFWRNILLILGIAGTATVGIVTIPKDNAEPEPTDTFECGRFKVVDGVLQPVLSDGDLIQQAAARGVEVERVYYAKPAANAKGDLQTRYYNLFIPSGTPKGIILYFHGGGGDVGSADGQDMLQLCASLADAGYFAASFEYRRGWTGSEPWDNFCNRADVFNQPEENYVRQRESAHLSFEDAETGVTHAVAKIAALTGRQLPSWATGTSFGGALACHIGYGDPELPKTINLQAVLNQYGGLSQHDPIYPSVPYFGVGGVDDALVPFWNGPSFSNPNGEPLYGTGGLGLELRKHGIPAKITAACGYGHGRGPTSEWGLIQTLLIFGEKPESITNFVKKGPTYTDSCFTDWRELRAQIELRK